VFGEVVEIVCCSLTSGKVAPALGTRLIEGDAEIETRIRELGCQDRLGPNRWVPGESANSYVAAWVLGEVLSHLCKPLRGHGGAVESAVAQSEFLERQVVVQEPDEWVAAEPLGVLSYPEHEFSSRQMQRRTAQGGC
jgi:hypothetical protein